MCWKQIVGIVGVLMTKTLQKSLPARRPRRPLAGRLCCFLWLLAPLMERRFSARSKQDFKPPSKVVMNDDRSSITLFLDVAMLGLLRFGFWNAGILFLWPLELETSGSAWWGVTTESPRGATRPEHYVLHICRDSKSIIFQWQRVFPTPRGGN